MKKTYKIKIAADCNKTTACGSFYQSLLRLSVAYIIHAKPAMSVKSVAPPMGSFRNAPTINPAKADITMIIMAVAVLNFFMISLRS